MLKRYIAALGLSLALPAWSQTTVADDTPSMQLDESAMETQQVLVTGRRPGPGLWKVSKGDHVLWIFGTYSPLPRKMEWRSRDVEDIVAKSQEFLPPPSANVHVGTLKALTALPFLVGAKNNPDGKTLKDVLPPDVYARWLPLRKKYFKDDEGIERERPVFVAEELYGRALAASGLGNGREVRMAIDTIVRKSKIKITESTANAEIKEPGKALKEFKKSAMDDTACFAKTLTQLETDIDAMRVRANAWAIGDLAVIENLDYADRKAACDAAFLSSPILNSESDLKMMRERVRQAWLASVDKSLETNSSTFAVLEMKDILDPHGLLAALRAKGYTVEPPK
ncbi:TraB/GumN family protein [Massilia horti]|uniref:TraB/GumN family protein n=1 Tax=Massilia horti TaxID=2562153 RepID=A0A4Y9T0E2_9BURK|nr:TraB/GumN family protein [Massilia horti]TFW32854.1 TraB/GumN family protein [Massilia horti]